VPAQAVDAKALGVKSDQDEIFIRESAVVSIGRGGIPSVPTK